MSITIPSLAIRLLQGLIVLLGGYVMLIILLWDADVITLKQRYDAIQHALLGGTDHQTTASFDQAMQDVHDITLFKSSIDTQLGLEIFTGVRYANPQDLAANTPNKQWCYTFTERDGLQQQIELAAQFSIIPPVYYSLDEQSDALQAVDVDPQALAQAAKAYCQFITLNNKPSSGGHHD